MSTVIRTISEWAVEWDVSVDEAKNRVMSMVSHQEMQPYYRVGDDEWTVQLTKYTGVPADKIWVGFGK